MQTTDNGEYRLAHLMATHMSTQNDPTDCEPRIAQPPASPDAAAGKTAVSVLKWKVIVTHHRNP
jgi:hypothetical protein